jgi:NNP family nitrate/nitrite transporter-like MFS transporter
VPRSSPSKWAMLGIAYLVLLAAYVPFLGWTPKLTSVMEDLSLNYTQAGALSSVAGLAAGIALLSGGVITSKWGPKNILLAGLAGGVIGLLLFAYADSYTVAMIARVISGAAAGFLFVGTYTVAVNWFQKSKETGRALGIMATGDGTGLLFALYVFAWVLTLMGWRGGLVAGAIGLVVVLAVVYFLVPGGAGSTDEAQTEQVTSNGTSARPGLLASVLRRGVIIAATFAIGTTGLFTLLAAWMPAVLVEGAGWSESNAGLVASSFAVVGITTALLGGFLSDRIGRKPVLVAGGFAGSLGVAGTALALSAGNYTLVAVCIPIIGLGIYLAFPVAVALAVEATEPEFVGAANGLVLGSGYIVGGFIYPLALGSIKDATGDYAVGFYALAVATFVLCALAPLLAKKTAHAAATGAGDVRGTDRHDLEPQT